jgi:tRNA threonylcarbamoyladenosine biosynthesis protein TsaB
MNCLAIDASTEVLSLCATKGTAAASLSLRHGLQHAPTLIPLIERMLAEISLAVRELSLIICSTGPGSFTGIRIGLATAKGISFGISCPVVGVSTLEAFALPYSFFNGDVYPVIDARKGKYYTVRFRGGLRAGEYLDEPPILLKERLALSERSILVGPDAESIRDRVLGVSDSDLRARVGCAPFTDPLAFVRLGERRFSEEGADPEGLIPLYLRKSEAEIAAERAS